jgi:hypothetical protein
LATISAPLPCTTFPGKWVLSAANSKVPKKSTLDPETAVIKCAGASVEIAT